MHYDPYAYSYNMYPYSPMYFPDPWRTTSVPHHFPEHHYPLETTRHTVASALSNFGHALLHPYEPDPPIYHPKADILESETTYYVDMELPGLSSNDHVKLRWLNPRTLLVSATLKRRKTEEDLFDSSESAAQATEPSVATIGVSNGDAKTTKTDDSNQPAQKSPKPEHKTFVTVRERTIGKFARAFNFSTSVSHLRTTTQLVDGILRIIVPKIEEQPPSDQKEEPKQEAGKS